MTTATANKCGVFDHTARCTRDASVEFDTLTQVKVPVKGVVTLQIVKYLCKAHNKVGTVVREMKMQDAPPPKPPKKSTRTTSKVGQAVAEAELAIESLSRAGSIE